MEQIELSDDDWARLKRALMTKTPEEALGRWKPPVRLTHGSEYVTYEKGDGGEHQ